MSLVALRSAGYRRYLIGNLFSLNGMWLSRVVMGWLAWEMSGQAGFVGIVAFLVFAPTLVSGPVFGVIADRIDLKRAAMLTQAGLGATALVLLVAARTGVLGPGLLVSVALAAGIVSSAHHPIRLALGPGLVPRGQIASAVTLGSVNFNLARLTGPAIGGGLIATLGIDWAMALTAACFLPLILLLPGLDPRPAPRAPRDEGLGAALRAGVAHAAGDPLIRRALATIGVFSLVGRGVLEILPALADGVFGRGAAGLGIMTGAAGAGALVAASFLALGAGQTAGGLPRTSRVAAPLGLVLVAVLALAPSWPVAVAAVAALGTCGTLVGVGLQTTIQLAVPDAYRGRIMSLWTFVAIGGSALGALGLGALVDLLGTGPALAGAAAAGLGALLAIGLRPLARRARPTTSDPETPPVPRTPAS